MLNKILYCLLSGLLLSTLSPHSLASDARLENQLILALKIKADGQDRQAESRPVIRAYQQAAIISKKPQRRADYIDFYLLQKPASFMGHQLILLEEEYMDVYVGCCASPGIGLMLKTNADTRSVQDFAKKNACTFTPHADVFDRLRMFGIDHKLARGDYAILSCRERDAQK
ncbi:hypothetical protein ACO0LF_24975 [Undibacterium sp. Di27W]|uniref:hypothetical protein n=1 Tax=Undibacterium sp. Di27W TaxID=3413036 RepID=UPI003BF260AD